MTDRSRPIYHFTPPRNWMNDPNGLIQIHGDYHLFYQHNPVAPVWGNMSWGHAVSRDLMHWRDLPEALRPDSPYDDGGVFTGCAVNDGGVATAIYTGVSPECQCVATSADVIHWRKDPENPVVAAPPQGLKVTGFRDPCVWKREREWMMVVGSGIQGRGGAALLYTSPDLRAWTYRGPMIAGDPGMGTMWECPNFVDLGHRQALIVSTLGRAIAMIGEYRDYKIEIESYAEVDAGGSLYAPQVFRDESGRHILFGWLQEARSAEEQKAAGWSGALSLPRIVTLGRSGGLEFRPAPEVRLMRRVHTRWTAASTDAETPLSEMTGLALWLRLSAVPGQATEIGLKVRAAQDGAEYTRVFYDAVTGRLSLDPAKSSLSAGHREAASTPIYRKEGDAVVLDVFVDHSVVEVYANGGVCLTQRIYPTREDSAHVSMFANGGRTGAVSVDCWTMNGFR